MLLVMVAMLGIVWLSNGHMGMMGQGVAHADKPGNVEQQAKAAPPVSSAPNISPEAQY